MVQLFKTVYFPGDAKPASGPRSLTLAFGEADRGLHGRVRLLTSHEVRVLSRVTSWGQLRAAAAEAGVPPSTHLLNLLRSSSATESDQLALWAPGPKEAGPMFDPLAATFRGGDGQLLHGWFPYLEGYSPRFVEQILERYAPEAKRVLDPFAGMGTTPLTAARLGLDAVYCEVNPVLQLLVDAKARVLTLSKAEQERLALRVDEIAASLDRELLTVPADHGLSLAYRRVFGSSDYFDASSFDQSCDSERSLIEWRLATS